jgi:hypothetical protein
VSYGPWLWTADLGTAAVTARGFYAVVDDEGFVGTLQATDRSPRCPLVGCGGIEEWHARWVEQPARTWGARDPYHGLLAFGPVNARYALARRVVPELPTDVDENNMPVPAAPRSLDAKWTRLVAIALSGEPSMIEVWGRRCGGNTASVRELRVVEDGRSRIVHRAVRLDAAGRNQLD